MRRNSCATVGRASLQEGITRKLAPHRAQLAAGFDAIRAHPTLFAETRGLLETLAARLRAAGIAHVDPIGAHAVFALFLELAPTDPSVTRSSKRTCSPIRASGSRLRAIPLIEGSWRACPADLDRIVAALGLAGDGVPTLSPVASDAVHLGYFGRYTLA